MMTDAGRIPSTTFGKAFGGLECPSRQSLTNCATSQDEAVQTAGPQTRANTHTQSHIAYRHRGMHPEKPTAQSSCYCWNCCAAAIHQPASLEFFQYKNKWTSSRVWPLLVHEKKSRRELPFDPPAWFHGRKEGDADINTLE